MLKYFLILSIIFIGFTILPAHATTEFTPFQNISNSSSDSISPFVTTVGKNVFIAWTEYSNGKHNADIFFSKSTDAGSSFSSPQNISKQGVAINPFIAINGTTIFITWTYQDQQSEIYFSKSTDGGATFSIPQKISADSSFSMLSKIATDGTNVFITWTVDINRNNPSRNMEIYFSKSTDGGTTFSAPVNLSNNNSLSSFPSITDDGKNIFITWQDASLVDTDIFISKSTDGGTTFSAPLNISNSSDGSVGAKIINDGKNIFATWFEFSDGIGDIFFSKSTDGGTTFSAPVNLSKNKENSIVPFMVTNGTDIFITWTDATATGSWITFSKSTDGGTTFSAPQIISNDKGFSDAQSIATDGTTLFVTWNYRTLQTSPYDVLFSKSASQMAIENTSEKISSDDVASKTQPNIVQEPENNAFLTHAKSLKWLNENSADYTINGWGVLRLDNPDLNVNKQLIDIPVVHVWSDTDPKGILVDVIETGADTGVFYADLALADEPSSHLLLQVSTGDSVTVSFDDLSDTVKITSKYISPRKQIESGLQPDEITCRDGLELVIKTDHRHHPICVTPDTKSKMIQRGLAMTIQTTN